jgi:hypothetical protein
MRLPSKAEFLQQLHNRKASALASLRKPDGSKLNHLEIRAEGERRRAEHRTPNHPNESKALRELRLSRAQRTPPPADFKPANKHERAVMAYHPIAKSKRNSNSPQFDVTKLVPNMPKMPKTPKLSSGIPVPKTPPSTVPAPKKKLFTNVRAHVRRTRRKA